MRSDVVAAARRDRVLPSTVLRPASDEYLVEQVHAGSERAFELLCDRHYRPVFAYCRSMLRSPEEAEDAVQQTFLDAYRVLVGMQEPIAALRPWLCAIARHRCLSALRASRTRPPEVGREPAADDIIAAIATREELRAILGDVAGLPDDQRAALALSARIGGRATGGRASPNVSGRLLCAPPRSQHHPPTEAQPAEARGRRQRLGTSRHVEHELPLRKQKAGMIPRWRGTPLSSVAGVCASAGETLTSRNKQSLEPLACLFLRGAVRAFFALRRWCVRARTTSTRRLGRE